MEELSVTEELSLVAAAKTDISAFERLYDLYFNYIYRYCRNRLPNKEMTEDVVSLVFTKAITAIKQFDTSKGFRFGSWLYKTAHNAIIDLLKKERHSQKVSLDDIEEFSELTASDPDYAEKTEERTRVLTVLETMHERYQFILTLRFFEDLSIERIAAVMNMKPIHVSTILYRALTQFKQKYCARYKTNDIFDLNNRYIKQDG
jgi:RNA polymerase sigma-70 factor (ECF subfamily)